MRTAALLALLFAGRSAAAQPAADSFPVADERMMDFAVAWSTDDEAAVRGLMAGDVVLLGREPLVGADAVMGWARQQMAGSGTLVLWPLHSEQHGDAAFQTGRWKLGAGTGVHTFQWQRQEDGVWRITSLYILDTVAG
ncbi:MAG: hypothetical protein ABJF88_06660 [Rhodothermales bacterium]